MNDKSLLAKKQLLEALLLANHIEVEFIRNSEGIDLILLDDYYMSSQALAAEHMHIVNQIERT